MFNKIIFYLSFIRFLKLLKDFEKMNAEQIIKHRDKAVKKIVRFAVKHSEFYREQYKNIDVGRKFSITELPLMDKRKMVENFDAVITKKGIKYQAIGKYFEKPFNFNNRYLDKYLAFHTSGSTGNPSFVLWDSVEFGKATAAFFYKISRLLYNSFSLKDIFRKINVAYIGILDDYVGGNSWAYAMGDLCNLKMISAFQPITNICDELNKFQPEVIMTKPTLLGELARRQRDKTLRINPKRIIFAGEMIQPADAEDIRDFFATVPYNSYSTCETGPVALQNSEASKLKIYNEMVYLELLDENNQPISECNQIGRIVITNLHNKVIPVIRYDIGDSAYYIREGSSYQLSPILGRTTSFFPFTDTQEKTVKIPEFLFWTIYEKGITKYQIIQKGHSELLLRLEWDQKLFEESGIQKETSRNAIIGKVKKIIGSYNNNVSVTIIAEDVAKITPNKNGKIKITEPLK